MQKTSAPAEVLKSLIMKAKGFRLIWAENIIFRSGKRLFIGPQFLPIYNLKSMQAKTQRDFQLQLLPIRKNGQRNFCFVRYPFLLIFISMIKKQILCQISVETSHTDNITKNSLLVRKVTLIT